MGFFRKSPQLLFRHSEDLSGRHRRFRPELPDRPQPLGKQAEKQHRTSGRPQQDIQTQFPIPLPQKKQPHTQANRQTIAAVQQPDQPRAALTGRTQQIVQQGDPHPQQDGAGKHHQLLGNIVLHISRTAAAADHLR